VIGIAKQRGKTWLRARTGNESPGASAKPPSTIERMLGAARTRKTRAILLARTSN